MRIVEINTVCDTGSTGRIAAAVARLAKERGHVVYFAYGRGSHPNDLNGYKIGNRIDFINHVGVNFIKGKSGFGSALVTKRFLEWLDGINPDIIHLHNIHGFYVNIEMLFDYIKKKNVSVVWTLHDCWAFTGQCAYFDYTGCEKWKEGCYECPVYRTDYPYSLFCDNSKENYSEKKRIFNGVKNLIIVTPSEWLKKLVKNSFLKDYSIVVINNGIDTEVFKHLDISDDQKKSFLEHNLIKKDVNFVHEKKIILGVANVWSARKGLESFYKLAKIMPNDYIIVLIGIPNGLIRMIRKRFNGRIIGIRHTESVRDLSIWYNISYVYVNPTMEDNYPTTNLEALACGTRIITYNTGGSPETVEKNRDKIVDKGDINGLRDAILKISNKESVDCDVRIHNCDEIDISKRLSNYLVLFSEMEQNKDIINGND